LRPLCDGRYNVVIKFQSSSETGNQRLTHAFPHKSLHGLTIPFPTPFDEDSEVDFSALRSNLEHWNSNENLSGYVALGSTGERVHLNETEARKVIEVAREKIPESRAFIVGAGQQSSRGTIEELRAFAGIGADAGLVITPYFYRRALTQTALQSFYLEVADASPIPIILYNMPDLTGIALAPETIARLSEHQNIVGVKDSSSDLLSMMETIRIVQDGFAVMTGNGPLFYAALGAGISGAILAVGCVALERVIEIKRAFDAGDRIAAARLHKELVPLARAVTSQYGIGGLKSAMEMIGLNGGTVRRPLCLPSATAIMEIKKALAESRLTTDSSISAVEV
jgi:4-hydroxy-2-oxoglutarate aldolase